MLKKKTPKAAKTSLAEKTSNELKESIVSEYHEVLIAKLLEKNKELKKTNKTLKKEIADRKRAEAQLNRVENILESAVGAIDEGFVIHDMTDSIVSANNSAAKILGLTTEQLLGKDSFDPRWKALHEDGTPFEPLEHPSMVTLRTGQPVNNVVMNVHIGDDFRRWISVNSRPIFDKDKKQTGAVATFRDITERKESNEKLKETLQQLNLAIDTAKLGVWVLNIDSGVLDWNDQLLEIYGISREDFKNNLNEWQQQIHPEDAAYANTRLEEVYENKSVYDVHFRIHRPNGELRYLDGSAAPIFVDNKLKKIIGINRDITDQKITLNDLITSETRYRTLFESARDTIFLLDDKGRIIDANTAMVNMFGYDDKSEVLNLSIWDISPKTQSDGSISKSIVLKKLKRLLVGDTELLTWDHQKKDGTLFKTEVSTSALQYNNNNYVLASVRDISERVKSEVALKESEEKFFNAFNSSPIALSIINIKTGQRLDVNTKFCELFGLDREDAIKGSIFKNNLATNQIQFSNVVKELKKTGHLLNTPLSLIDGNDKALEALINATNTISNDKDVFIVSYMDMTEIKEAEAKLKKVEAKVFETMINAEEKERARYAKELHDGLGPIISTSMIYLHTLRSEDDEEKQKEYINRTYSLLEDATQSIREISLNLSPDILTKYGLVHAIRSFIEKLKAITSIKFEISSNLKSMLPHTVRFTLYRTLTELINNSIKHSEATKILIVCE
ncbi:MAG: PAS domain S-box protein [Eudoraea sp.]|nr:PAS domain S-box protein [Eudoraea sp.]